MAVGPYRFVTFTPDDAPQVIVRLDIEGEFTITAGLLPDINQALVPYVEFEKLANTSYVGTVSFWTSADFDPEPDVVVKGVGIVDVQAVRFGRIAGDIDRIVEYRLYLADWRRRIVEPRGGRLSLGDLNPEPLPPDMTEAQLTNNKDLVEECLARLGVAFSAAPTELTVLPPVRNLKWLGAHAASELARLLEFAGAVFCPRFNPEERAVVEMMGQGIGPTIPQADELPTLELPASDRRSKTVIISSAPKPITESWSFEGYGSPNDPIWYFVIQDADDKWRKIDDPNGLLGADPRSHVRRHFIDVAPEHREKAALQAYRFIQLDTVRFPPPWWQLIEKHINADFQAMAIAARARFAKKDSAGNWSNAADKFAVPAKGGDPHRLNIVEFGPRLGKVSGSVTGGVADWETYFEPLEHGELEVQFAVESGNEQREEKEYFYAGFTVDQQGEIVRLTQEQILAILDGAPTSDLGVMVIEHPELRLLRLDGLEVNRQPLEDFAELLARQYLAGDGTDGRRTIAARGFVAANLSGLVTQIRYDQRNLLSTFELNAWWAPSIATLMRGPVYGISLGTAQAMPQQLRTAEDRARLGEAGAAAPALRPSVPSRDQPQATMCRIHLEEERTEGGHYKAITVPGGQEVWAINTIAEPAGKHFAPIDPNPDALEAIGQLGQIRTSDGLREVFFAFDWHVDRSFRMGPQAGMIRWFQGHPTPNYTGTEDWRDRIEFEICPPPAS